MVGLFVVFPKIIADIKLILYFNFTAYKYGSTLVPFSEEDKRNMNYEPGEKGIKILGFTKSENVSTL